MPPPTAVPHFPEAPASPPRLLDRLRATCRVRHYSPRTEEAYAQWVRRFILFQGKRHPIEMGAAEVNALLTHLAVKEHVAASTQNQAFCAILFLYQKVHEVDPGRIAGAVRAQRPQRLPIVLSRAEVRAVLGALEGTPRLVALLLYGAGLRLLDALRLRVQHLDFTRNEVLVRHGKGGKDRRTVLPATAKGELLQRLDRLRPYYERDMRDGVGVSLPEPLDRKYPRAATEWGVVLRVPGPASGDRPAGRTAEAPPPARERDPAGGAGGGAGRRGGPAGYAPRLPACLRHAPAGGRLRHPHGAGIAGPCPRGDDDGLYARAE
jgi:integrase